MSFIGFRRSVAVLVVVMAMLVSLSESKCAFEAIFNFGDSNTDTGGFSAAFPASPAPNGMTYFKQPAGRVTDGRLITDFLAQAFGLPFLSPYLQSVGSDYRHGVNFAIQGSTAIEPTTSRFDSGGISPFSLGIQLNQMKHFKGLVDALSSSKAQGPTNLPPPDIFGKSLYTLYIGLKYSTRACCGAGVKPTITILKFFVEINSKDIDGKTITASACSDPNNYVSWDGVHTTEAANKIVANAILSGSYFDLPQFCDIQPIG